MAGVDDKTVILFDGKDWSKFTDKDTTKPSGFTVAADGIGIAGGHDTISKDQFGDFQMHVEFMCPVTNLEGQARSNSGVYVHGRYEIQVLDSFGDEPKDNLCGGIYKVATPLVSVTAAAKAATVLNMFIACSVVLKSPSKAAEQQRRSAAVPPRRGV